MRLRGSCVGDEQGGLGFLRAGLESLRVCDGLGFLCGYEGQTCTLSVLLLRPRWGTMVLKRKPWRSSNGNLIGLETRACCLAMSGGLAFPVDLRRIRVSLWNSGGDAQPFRASAESSMGNPGAPQTETLEGLRLRDGKDSAVLRWR